MRTSIPIPELKARLNDGLPQILFDILRDLKPDGRDRWKGYAPNGDMIAVVSGGIKKGYVYNTTGSGRGDGNVFNLIESLHCDGNVVEACRLCERILGLDPGGWKPDPAQAERLRQEQKKTAEESEQVRRENFKAWLQEHERGTPQTPDSLSGRYLRGRCCPLSLQLRDARSPYDGSPVMLAPMVDPETLVTKAIHATKLVERDGQVIKSPARPVRLTSGYPRACVIPLCHGESGLSLEQASHKNLVEALMLGEGLENSLTAHVEFPRLRLFAAGSVGNFANIALPPWYNPILLVRDREGPENMGPAAARRRAIEQWMRDGRRVEIIDPPPGVKDVNDAARAFARR